MKVIAVLVVALATVSAVESVVESFDSGVDFPFAVSCKYQTLLQGQTLCSGTIISSKLVLTTAQCMKNALWVTIYGGSNFFLVGILTRTVLANFFIKHPDYDPITLDYNLGLIPVYGLTFDSRLASVNLPPPDFIEYLDDTIAVSVGWGRSSSPGQPIQGINVELMSNSNCLEQIPNISSLQLCADVSVTGTDCQNFPGGAVIANNTLIGVVSWGITPGCREGIPNVYARVSSFVTWISQRI